MTPTLQNRQNFSCAPAQRSPVLRCFDSQLAYIATGDVTLTSVPVSRHGFPVRDRLKAMQINLECESL